MCIDRELRKEHEDEFGLDTEYTGYSYYTREKQIERYAKNMLFWDKHRPTIDVDKIDSDVQAKLFLCIKSDITITTQDLRTYTCITKINTRKG